MKYSEQLPDFFILGAEKSGTTSLYYYLNQHPGFFFSKIKEPGYFSYVVHKPRMFLYQEVDWSIVVDNLEAYSMLYEPALPGQLKGDASTVYLYDYETVIDQIKRHYAARVQKLKFIAILRNPIFRAWSKYTMAVRDGIEELSPLEAFHPDTIRKRMRDGAPLPYDYIGFGMYCGQLKAYRDAFGPFEVILLDDLENDPISVLEGLVDYLGLSPFSFNVGTRFNVSGQPKNALYRFVSRLIFQDFRFKSMLKKALPYSLRLRIRTSAGDVLFQSVRIPDDVYSFLLETYREEILKLGEILKRDLSRWLKR
ncbi:MAG: sulfotransferase [Acidobacteria bacterium]|nr:sulfotransferase [Acidobacteriota bacterium]